MNEACLFGRIAVSVKFDFRKVGKAKKIALGFKFIFAKAVIYLVNWCIL